MSCGVGDIEDLFTAQTQPDEPRGLQRKIVRRQPPKRKVQAAVDEETKDTVPGVGNIMVKTYGCSHNISDSEFMQGQLVEYGFNLVDDIEIADCCLFNSCTVKNPTQDALIHLVKRAKDRGIPIVVSGCVPQGDRNLDGLEGISIIGVTQIDRVVEVVEEAMKGNVI